MTGKRLLALKLVKLSLVVLMLFLFGCSKKGDLSSLSPREIVDKYHKASGEGDYELMRQIMYFPPDATEAEIRKKVGYGSDPSIRKNTKDLTEMIGIKPVSHYEKFLDENAAEVGIGIKAGVGPLSKFIPVDQMILKKQDGIWKVDYSRNQLTREQLTEEIVANPKTPWPYYYLGWLLQGENPYKSYKCYKKYCTLAPDGFFVSNRLLEKFERFENLEEEERMQLDLIRRIPEGGSGRLHQYLHLCQLFTETGDYAKAKKYLGCAEDFIKKQRKLAPFLKDRYENRKKTLQSHMEGKTNDLLDKLL